MCCSGFQIPNYMMADLKSAIAYIVFMRSFYSWFISIFDFFDSMMTPPMKKLRYD